mmetsp:Transcript_5690/g.9778  ORF Transcript_5690/g.9778 Transcript_5690/m.9778 type:complete len:216 (+) Transcript_5690:1429-2076(+)
MQRFLHFMPQFPFVRSIFILANACGWRSCLIQDEEIPQEIHDCLQSMLINSVVILLLAVYLNEVVPQEFGIARHPLFFMEDLVKSQAPQLHKLVFGDESHLAEFRDETELIEEDGDAKNERDEVRKLSLTQIAESPLIVRDLRKVYPGTNGRKPKVANKSISLRVSNGELFGLLGPNGAGKTTLISQLTGLYPPTEGNAWIGGYSIKSQLEIVQL